ncbi:MAG TPA: PAS domain S-box protein [Chthonomonadaceae bacterium]|nr:PAS domain S-box protein [Chthonomonadaceae bacterium]
MLLQHTLQPLQEDKNADLDRLQTENAQLRQQIAWLTQSMQSGQRIEAALRESEERFSKAFHASPDAITITILGEGRFVELNEGFTKLFGYSREEAVGSTTLGLGLWISPEERNVIRECLKRGETVRDMDVKMRHKSGEVRHAQIRAEVIEFQGIPCVLAVTRDVTEQKRMEAALREREEAALQFQQDLKALHDVGIELSTVESVDALCRLAVERGQERFGFDRLSIWLVSDDQDTVSGTYGTDEAGNIRSEQDRTAVFGEAFRQRFFAAQPVRVRHDCPLYNHLGEEIGQGWHMSAALRDGERVVGVMYVDNLLCQHPLKEHQPELLGLYGATLGQLYARARAEAALRASEEHFRMILENSTDVSCLVSTDGTLLYRSPSGTRLFGYTPAERLNKCVFDIVHPDDIPGVTARFQELLATPNAQVTVTYRGQHKDGNWLWLESCLTNQLHEASIRAVVINTRDVTERKHAEAALRHTVEGTASTDHEFFPALVRGLAESLHVRYAFIGVLEHPTTDRVRTIAVWANGAFEENIEYELPGTPCENLLTGSLCFYRSDVQAMFPEDILLQHMGVESYLGIPLHSSQGEVIGLLVVLHDQAIDETLQPMEILQIFASRAAVELERMGAVEALQEREERLRLALQAGGMGTWHWHTGTDRIFWSENVAPLFGLEAGCSPDTVSAFMALVLPEDQAAMVRHFREAIASHREVALEFRVLRPDGDLRWLATYGQIFYDEQGAVSRISGVLFDVTPRKQADQQLEESLKQLRYLTGYLQSVQEKERAHIAREVHDELGQALTGLKMDASWLKRHLCQIARKPAPEALCRKLDGMTDLIDTTIQTVRRIATELRPAVLDTLGLVSALEWQAQEFQKRTGIRCDFFVESAEVALERADSTAVFRIFQETLTNITRHAQATYVEARLSANEESLVLEVRDNGIGMVAASCSGAPSFGLLGMQERALLLGGELLVKGEPGRGTTVTLCIPLPRTQIQEG